jgi:hypothetical protein
MNKKQIDQLVLQMENYLECWKQFSHYLDLARTKKFGLEDESQFLEIKSILTQELEIILSLVDYGTPTREEIHGLISSAPSIRFLSELTEGSLRSLENQWHKIYINWQSILGQLKVQQQETRSKSFWYSLFHHSK